MVFQSHLQNFRSNINNPTTPLNLIITLSLSLSNESIHLLFHTHNIIIMIMIMIIIMISSQTSGGVGNTINALNLFEDGANVEGIPGPLPSERGVANSPLDARSG